MKVETLADREKQYCLAVDTLLDRDQVFLVGGRDFVWSNENTYGALCIVLLHFGHGRREIELPERYAPLTTARKHSYSEVGIQSVRRAALEYLVCREHLPGKVVEESGGTFEAVTKILQIFSREYDMDLSDQVGVIFTNPRKKGKEVEPEEVQLIFRDVFATLYPELPQSKE